MDNIVRPNFGAGPRPVEASDTPAVPTPSPDEYRLLQPLGEAAGYLVGIIRDQVGPEGRTHCVVIGLASGNEIKTVAVLPATREGEIDVERIAMAILRTLEIVEAGRQYSAEEK